MNKCRKIARQPVDLRDYMQELPTGVIALDTPLVTLARVSTKEQSTNGNLERSHRNLIELASVDYEIAGSFKWWGSITYEAYAPILDDVVEFALKHGASILIEKPSRIIRSRDYHPHRNPHAPITREDVEVVVAALRGVPLYVLSFDEKYTSNAGGAPLAQDLGAGYRARRKDTLLPEVEELVRWNFSSREIASELAARHPKTKAVTHTAIANWMNEKGVKFLGAK